MDAELVLDAAGSEIVCGSERAVVRDELFGGEEQRHAFRPGRRARQSRQHKMDDVLGHIVVAPGDEDLLARDSIKSFAVGFRARAQCGEVRAGLRLGQVHRARPFAGYKFRQIKSFLPFGSVRAKRFDRALREHGAKPERHVGAVHHFKHGDFEDLGQVLAAILRIGRQGVPAALRKGTIGIGEAGSRAHLAVLELGARLVAAPVEGREHVAS